MRQRLKRLWSRLTGRAETPPPATHLGGRGVPKIVGICRQCGAVVVEGLHQKTPDGYLCQRCANRRDAPPRSSP